MKMSRAIVVAFAILALLQAASANSDISKVKNIQIDLTEKDIVPKTTLKNLESNTFTGGFIGNIEIGQRFPDEVVLRRVIEFENPTNNVQSTTITLTANRGIIHYVRILNDPGSYAVICDEPNSLGSSRGNFNIRVSPRTKSTLTVIAAAHNV
ncbi:uncharacterized protein LOC109857585 [Pseudomyrmex gracilis]|uniref:uncharacterized protein LOC109857585 n=1 Tax=Pseudomyrmex gracilis TaxID=219809 RepID=UPI000995CF56|nr:uncharacterized protein LOC109857585 [Pseudomyrmex gracilis]